MKKLTKTEYNEGLFKQFLVKFSLSDKRVLKKYSKFDILKLNGSYVDRDKYKYIYKIVDSCHYFNEIKSSVGPI